MPRRARPRSRRLPVRGPRASRGVDGRSSRHLLDPVEVAPEIALRLPDRTPSVLVPAGVLVRRSSCELPVSMSQTREAVDQLALDRLQGSRCRRRGDRTGGETVSRGEVAACCRLGRGARRLPQLLERRGTGLRKPLELPAHGTLVVASLRGRRRDRRLRGGRVVACRAPEEQPGDGSHDNQSRGAGDPRERPAGSPWSRPLRQAPLRTRSRAAPLRSRPLALARVADDSPRRRSSRSSVDRAQSARL